MEVAAGGQTYFTLASLWGPVSQEWGNSLFGGKWCVGGWSFYSRAGMLTDV